MQEGRTIIITCFLVGFISLLILLSTIAIVLESASGTAMGDLPCLPHLPLPPTMWSMLRTSVSLHANGDGPGCDTVIIQHNSLLQFARAVANSVQVSHRKCDKFMNETASLFSSPHHPGHYNIDIVVCILDEVGVSISSGQWDQVKEFLRTTACRRVRLNTHRHDIFADSERDTGSTHAASSAFSRSRSRTSLPGSSTNVSVDAASTENFSSTSSRTEVLTLRAMVNQLQSRNTLLESVLDSKNNKVVTLQKEKRMLQQQVRRLRKSFETMNAKAADAHKDSMANNFSLMRVKNTNPGKWSWLTPLGKINVAVACQRKPTCLVETSFNFSHICTSICQRTLAFQMSVHALHENVLMILCSFAILSWFLTRVLTMFVYGIGEQMCVCLGTVENTSKRHYVGLAR